MNLPKSFVNTEQWQDLQSYLTLPDETIDLASLWRAMDRIWDALGLDTEHPDPQLLAQFYAHPIWALNAAFVGSDPESLAHRQALVAWLAQIGAKRVLDYGGGYGTLARMIVQQLPDCEVVVYEPYLPEQVDAATGIRYVDRLDGLFDAVLVIDVLEHIPEPLAVLEQLTRHVRLGGYFVDGSNFYPLIKCHLPSTFYLRYGFAALAYLLGFTRQERLYAAHATSYRRSQRTRASWKQLRFAQLAAQRAYPLLWKLQLWYRWGKQHLRPQNQ